MINELYSRKLIHLSTALEKRKPQRTRDGSEHLARIISVTSGKGGVGKTNIVINLGLALKRLDKRVLILDADLGLGNLDVLLGLAPRYNLSHVLRGIKTMEEIIVNGPEGIMILPASNGIQEMAHLTGTQRFKLISELDKMLQTNDILLIDTASGISSDVTYFNVKAQEILIVVTPEPTSITDAYALIKVLSLKYRANQFNVVVNKAQNMHEAEEVFRQLHTVTDKFLTISIQYMGAILFDELVQKSARRQRILMDMHPNSPAARCYAALAKRVNTSQPLGGYTFGIDALWKHFRSE
ncbi:MinD/ParA family protein [Desulfococcus sp.]|uniref:MinD/ParA family protein n=1 Tax=Desulfococcus sp. TaxID=2025834 RepID=UPI0035939716